MNPGLFILLIVLIAGGLAFVYLKILEDPEERFRKMALRDYGNPAHPTVASDTKYYYLKVLDEAGKLVTDIIINLDDLIEGKENIIGRMDGNPESKKLIDKIDYRIRNRNKYLGIRVKNPRPTLSRTHFLMFKDSSRKPDELAIQYENKPEDIGTKYEKKVFVKIGDSYEEPEDQQVVVSDYKNVTIKAGEYRFCFKEFTNSDFDDHIFMNDYIERHSRESNNRKKLLKTRKNDPYATKSGTEPQGGTVVYKEDKPSSGGGRKIRR